MPTLLIVDDTTANLQVAVRLLEAYSYEVLTALDGETGLRRAAMAAPDLILLDVEMPGIDGFEVCRRLQADPALRETPVLFLTVRTDRAAKQAAFAAGAVDFVTKPIDADELLARVQVQLRLLEAKRQLTERNAELVQQTRERREELARELSTREALIADKDRLSAEREQMLNVIHAQSDQIRRLTSDWVAKHETQGGRLYRSFKQRARDRFLLVDTLVAEAQRVVDAHVHASDGLAVAMTHLRRARSLLSPALSPAGARDSWAENAAPEDVDPLAGLSKREREVLKALVDGLSYKETAATLGLSSSTVGTYRQRIKDKLGAEDFASLVKIAVRYL